MPHLKKGQTRLIKPQPKPFGNKSTPWYNSKRWRNVAKLTRLEHPMCEVFPDEAGQYTDHIIPIVADENGTPLPIGGAPYDERNLMVMSKRAHDIKRGKERHGFQVDSIATESGLIPKRRMDVVEAIRKGKVGGLV